MLTVTPGASSAGRMPAGSPPGPCRIALQAAQASASSGSVTMISAYAGRPGTATAPSATTSASTTAPPIPAAPPDPVLLLRPSVAGYRFLLHPTPP